MPTRRNNIFLCSLSPAIFSDPQMRLSKCIYACRVDPTTTTASSTSSKLLKEALSMSLSLFISFFFLHFFLPPHRPLENRYYDLPFIIIKKDYSSWFVVYRLFLTQLFYQSCTIATSQDDGKALWEPLPIAVGSVLFVILVIFAIFRLVTTPQNRNDHDERRHLFNDQDSGIDESRNSFRDSNLGRRIANLLKDSPPVSKNSS